MDKTVTRIAVTGAAGKMGKAIVRCAGILPGLRVVAALESAGHPETGKDAGLLAGVDPIGVPVTTSLADGPAADVLVDFSHHSAAPTYVAAAAAAGTAVVLGTTGLNDEEAAAVKGSAGATALLWAPNMSLGMNYLFAVVRQAAAVLGQDYDIEIIETHHRHKRDAPSGSALRLAEQAAAGRGRKLGDVACFGRSGLVGARPAGEIGIHAVRGGDYVGEHIVRFAADGEVVEFVHKASNRDTFALGALRAARWLHGRPPGLYQMQDVLGL